MVLTNAHNSELLIVVDAFSCPFDWSLLSNDDSSSIDTPVILFACIW